MILFIVPAVVTLIPHAIDKTQDGVPFAEALTKLYEAGADVVGLNCGRGPTTMIPLIKDIRKTYKVTYVQIIKKNVIYSILFYSILFYVMDYVTRNKYWT